MEEYFTPDEIFIRKLTDIILANLGNENFGVEELARASGKSLYILNRRLRSIKGKTVNQFIREIRLFKAREMLCNEEYSASEIAYMVGFGSATYFNKSFHEFFGYPPGEVKKRAFNNQGVINVDQSPTISRQKTTAWKTFIFSLPGIFSIGVLIVIIIILVFVKILNSEKSASMQPFERRISIAILPFQNKTNDTTLNIWQDGIQLNLIASLSNVSDLQVIHRETVNAIVRSGDLTKYASITPRIAGRISQRLEADIIISGNIQKAGSMIRVSAQLIDTKTNEVLTSVSIERPASEENFFLTTDTLSESIRDFLLMSKMIQHNPMYQLFQQGFKSPEVLRCVMFGDEERLKGFDSMARNWYLKALAIDSDSFDANLGFYLVAETKEESLRTLLKLYCKKDKMSDMDRLYTNWAYAVNFESPGEVIEYLKQLQKLEEQNPFISWSLGAAYNNMNEYYKAISELERSFVMRRKLGGVFMENELVYKELGYAYHKTGNYKKEKKLYKNAEKYIPDNRVIISRQAILGFAEKDTVAANRYIEKYKYVCKEMHSNSEADIEEGLAFIYSEAGIMDKAEVCYRHSLSLEPDNPSRMNNLAKFLIDSNRSLNEVPSIMDIALELASNKYDYYEYSDTKGWSLYKLGKYHEARDILQKTWKSTPFPMYFIYLHIQEVKKAIALN